LLVWFAIRIGSETRINAYHQPGVEAGKKPEAAVLSLQAKAHAALSNTQQTATQIAAAIGTAESAETTYLILEPLAANGRAKMAPATDPGDATFSRV
jgi:glucose-6-phosphate isomerase